MIFFSFLLKILLVNQGKPVFEECRPLPHTAFGLEAQTCNPCRPCRGPAPQSRTRAPILSCQISSCELDPRSVASDLRNHLNNQLYYQAAIPCRSCSLPYLTCQIKNCKKIIMKGFKSGHQGEDIFHYFQCSQ